MLSNPSLGTTIVDFNLLNFGAMTKADPLSGLHYHFVFSANTEINKLPVEKRQKFYYFIANTIRIQQGNVEAIGGINESVNILVSLNLGQNPADFIKRIKLLTASWARRNLNLADFAWREEEVSTVSESQCRFLSQRIERQNKDFLWKKFSLAN